MPTRKSREGKPCKECAASIREAKKRQISRGVYRVHGAAPSVLLVHLPQEQRQAIRELSLKVRWLRRGIKEGKAYYYKFNNLIGLWGVEAFPWVCAEFRPIIKQAWTVCARPKDGKRVNTALDAIAMFEAEGAFFSIQTICAYVDRSKNWVDTKPQLQKRIRNSPYWIRHGYNSKAN